PRDELPLTRVLRIGLIGGELLDVHRPAERHDQVLVPGRERVTRNVLFGQAARVGLERVAAAARGIAPARGPARRAHLLERNGSTVRGRVEVSRAELSGAEPVADRRKPGARARGFCT